MWKLALVVIAIGVLGSVFRPGVSSTLAASDLTPNLQALPATELRLETTIDGRVLLRFSTTTWNSGTGPLELVPGTVDTGSGKQQVYQRIYNDAGGYTDSVAGWFEWHSDPDHNHLHFDNYALYELSPVEAPGGSGRIGAKTTFCVIDTDRVNHRLDGAPKRSTYRTCDGNQGLSVGWGDTYRYYLGGQELDVTGLPAGVYSLAVTADPNDNLVELDESDNESVILIQLDAGAGTVQVLDDSTGSQGDCPPGKERRNLC